jgi:hypothetical protein
MQEAIWNIHVVIVEGSDCICMPMIVLLYHPSHRVGK